MEGRTDIENAKILFGENFIGPEELKCISGKLDLYLPQVIPPIKFEITKLEMHSNDSILILGIEKMNDGEILDIFRLREIFGVNPDESEPCFYNQDWYLKEQFIKKGLRSDWYLIKKEVDESSRSVLPQELSKKYVFPSAMLCAFTFFCYYLKVGKILWQHDYVWCSDLDHNGDRIYIGNYKDSSLINKNGFSIHRHLSLKNSYGSITVYEGNV